LTAPLILEYLDQMNITEASDLYLTQGACPLLRVDNKLLPIGERKLSAEKLLDMLTSFLTTRQIRDFESNKELNTALDAGEHGRFRINVLRQRQAPAIVIRRIVSKIPSLKDLSLPDSLANMSLLKRGLILVTGMTGSGKSTSLAAMLDYRNTKSQGHIITIEDPIEYFHEHKASIVTQREVGVDTDSYTVALKNALRQRPDVILVGEIRDRDVMEQTVMAAETGHLCLATLHTNNAYQAIERVINFFPEDMHDQVRLNLAMNLRAVISQRLLPSLQGGMVPALEVMINQGLIKDLIRDGDIVKIRDVMAQNVSMGMKTFDQSLLELFLDGKISEKVALATSDSPGDMKRNVQKAKRSVGDNSGLADFDTSTMSISE
jgi:twitching motility protein PilU